MMALRGEYCMATVVAPPSMAARPASSSPQDEYSCLRPGRLSSLPDSMRWHQLARLAMGRG